MTKRENILCLFERQKPELDKKIADGIERYRKGDALIRVTDAEGRPIAGAAVKAVQKSHKFRFGANLFLLDELKTAEENDTYKKYFSDVFNTATLPFYWDSIEPEKGMLRYGKDSFKIYRRPAPDLCLDFCEKNGIEPREHALAYDAFFPKWLEGASVGLVKLELERRFEEIAYRYADKIPTIEVTNEMEWERGRTSFYDSPDYVEWCFKTAEKYFPRNILCINEYTPLCWQDRGRTTDKYYAYTEANMLKGARIDAVGMQYHLFNSRETEYDDTRKTLDPQKLYRHLDMYSQLGKPIHITEISVPAYSWTDDDEQIQAKVIEWLYSLWFSHPAVSQIIYWNLVDGYAHLWNPDPEMIKASLGNMSVGENYYHSGLLRFDLTPKPAYFKIKELTSKVWHTEKTAFTDSDGTLSFRGFYGGYDIEINVSDRTVCGHYELSETNKCKTFCVR